MLNKKVCEKCKRYRDLKSLSNAHRPILLVDKGEWCPIVMVAPAEEWPNIPVPPWCPNKFRHLVMEPEVKNEPETQTAGH